MHHSHVWNAGVGTNEAERKRDTTFFSFTVVAQTCCQSVQSHIGPMRVHGASHGSHSLRCAQKKTFTLHRAMSYITPHLMTPRTGTPSSLILNHSFSEHKPCGDLRPQLSGAVAEPRPFTGSEPKQLAEDRDYKHCTEDRQLTEHEASRVKPLSFHQSITASTYDSAGSMATPLPESDLDDEQLRALLASPLYFQEREASAERAQVCHSERENLMSSSSQDPTSTGNLSHCFQAIIG